MSPWGKLVWAQGKKEIYEKQLLASIIPQKIVFGKRFEDSVPNLSSDRILLINERIDQLTRYFSNKQDNPSSLRFEQIEGKPVGNSTHEFYAWSDKDAKRIFGHFENDQFILDKLDKHL